MDFPKVDQSNEVFMSQDGLRQFQQNCNPDYPFENINWTIDLDTELPIFMSKDNGPNSELPLTVPEFWWQQLKIFKDYPALSTIKNGVWKTINYQEYYELCEYYAIAMIKLGLTERSTVNILGFNSVEWMVSFHGSIFANMVPAGIYNTSTKDICKYIAEHSEAALILVDNIQQLKKYLEIIDNLPQIKYLILMNEYIPSSILPPNSKVQIKHFTELIQIGQTNYSTLHGELLNRMQSCRPGHCSHLVYTSGTTGVPKAAMISHDSFTWNTKRMRSGTKHDGPPQFVSFLPLSHVATQIVEVIGTLLDGGHVWFAEQRDLAEGTLVDKWRFVRPSLIVGVPRVFEKIKDKIQLIAQKESGYIQQKIASWVKTKGAEGTFKEHNGQETDCSFKLAKWLVYDRVKKQMGLDRIQSIVNGAAPLSPEIRKFFLELNIMITICFGMTETVGGHCFTDLTKFDKMDDHVLTSVGQCIEGGEVKIYEPDENGVGELCCKGRNIFIGYYKDREATTEVIDNERFLHTQDLGKIDKNGNVSIVGRIKDLIITSGGENVAPQQLADAIKQSSPQLISQVHIIGDQRKFLTALITLKEKDPEESESGVLAESAVFILEKNNCSSKTVYEAIYDSKLQKLVEQAVHAGNKKGASQVAKVKKWTLMPKEFTIKEGELTSTMKIRRQIVENKYAQIIEDMYNDDQMLSLEDSKL